MSTDNFDPETMPDYEARFDSGEFENKTTEEIIDIYKKEISDEENYKEFLKSVEAD